MQQTNVEGSTFAEIRILSGTGNDAGSSLLKELQPLLAPHGVGPESLSNAIKEALRETGEKYRSSPEQQRTLLIGLILWKVFARDSALWINSETEAGNGVSLDLLVTAYSMWRNAVNLASKHALDAVSAAEVLAQATHTTADQLAKTGPNSDSGEIRDIRKYLFASYMYAIFNIAGKQGTTQTDYVDMSDWISNRELSDRGAFLEAVESGILCKELLEAMPPKGRSVAIARYILGYSWPETAGALDSSVNAAQKALSAGIRKALGMCMRELRKVSCQKVAEIENHLMKNKKDSIWR
jgi:DNA-directed RNA polymerase specialized sigma24 family protein